MQAHVWIPNKTKSNQLVPVMAWGDLPFPHIGDHIELSYLQKAADRGWYVVERITWFTICTDRGKQTPIATDAHVRIEVRRRDE
mgnify:CR=1 FL=1